MGSGGCGRGEGSDRRAFLKSAAAAAGLAVVREPTGKRRAVVADGRERAPMPEKPMLGANLNGRPHRLANNLELLDASNTAWVRAFLDVRAKLNNGFQPWNDPDVVALRRAALEKNCRLVVNLKWNFKVNWQWDDTEPMNVPESGSERERELLRCATRYLRNVGAPVDVVVLGNEPMWETKREDTRGEDPPIVEFTRNLKDHLVRHGDHGTPAYLVGAFNRLFDDVILQDKFSAFCRGMFRLAREDDDIDGLDLHVHYGRFEQARKTLEVARTRVPDGVLTVTEFSPVKRYARNVRTEIGTWASGRQFAAEYGYPPEMTAVDYFEQAKADPRPSGELADFFDAMPWYRADHLQRNHRLFEQFDVSVGTVGFVQGTEMRQTDWRRPDWMPFHINFLYQQALLRGRGDHLLFIDDYRSRTGASDTPPTFTLERLRSIMEGPEWEWPGGTDPSTRRTE